MSLYIYAFAGGENVVSCSLFYVVVDTNILLDASLHSIESILAWKPSNNAVFTRGVAVVPWVVMQVSLEMIL